jgi:hypothetical protein
MARDLMFQQEIKETVREAYGAISTGGGATVARRLYSDQELAEVPSGAVEWALGVGNPVRYARLRPGEVVLDVGSAGASTPSSPRPGSGPAAGLSGWTCWRRCASGAAVTPPRRGSTAGASSSRGRWRTSRCPTRRWTW